MSNDERKRLAEEAKADFEAVVGCEPRMLSVEESPTAEAALAILFVGRLLEAAVTEMGSHIFDRLGHLERLP